MSRAATRVSPRARAAISSPTWAAATARRVNGQPLASNRAYLLHNGDRFKVGLVVLQFWLR